MRGAVVSPDAGIEAPIEWDEGEVRLPELPLWQGLQARPGVHRTFPFALGVDAIGLVRQTSPANVRRAVTEAYAGVDYAHITAPPGASEWADRLGRRQFDFVERWGKLGDGLSILEIGAGSDFVAAAVRRSWPNARYTVVDPTFGESRSIEVIADYFPSERLSERTFERILSFNCLEHVEDPAAFLDAVHRRLAPGGKVILSFPDTERQLRASDLNALTHEHLSYFTRASANRLFARSGLRAIAWNSDEESLWVLLQAADGGTGGAHEPAADERILSRLGARLTGVFEERRQAVRIALEEGTVAFHGATNGLNNFLYLADLGNAEGIVAFDCDSSKAGRFLPALSSPVRHCEDADYGKIGRVYVSATTFFAEIRAFLIDHHEIPPTAIEPLFPDA